MRILTGKEVADSAMDEIHERNVQFFNSTGIKPCLAVVLVGNDPASTTYVASKHRACEQIGFLHKDIHLSETATQDTLNQLIQTLNSDPEVHGILVQIPLPKHLNEALTIGLIDPRKDVDGLHPYNMGRLLLGQPGFVSCTPAGILRILDYYRIPTEGKETVVVGRSNIVGKPIAALLMQKGRDATVTICHSKTNDLGMVTRRADILIVAIGIPQAINSSMVKPGAVVIDIGINRIEDSSRKRGYRLVGDVDYDSVAQVCEAITPVPGGVGLMTIAMLMQNTLDAALLQLEKE
ncbi:MAG: bifunctional methylenetetrahydrofolate dehydrogenase/methenyltetrahydrofolate cyclohydrolase FolD [Spirochaetae bacterium HGW-Spirochaetae-8]|nr:MAG: bifunctional methylenetetrahydrofolate dehydrogenase/methenyltetrahydrofolate cyclohydrolase FolD [Spirochaetae bacterium HGW-Spirochaetae-8]